MENSCALCRSCGETGAARKRRKSLYGNSCFTERLVLQNVLARRQLRLNSSRDLNNPDAFLCLLCQRQLLKVKKLEEEIKSTVAELDLKINLHCGMNFLLYSVSIVYTYIQ